MKASQVLLSAVATGWASALPSSIVERQTKCGQYDTTNIGPYTVESDLWNQGAGGRGSQCYTVNGLNGADVAWSTKWSWAGSGNNVISYSNVAYPFSAAKLKTISSVPTSWSWSYSTNSVVADVSYDMFTSSSPNGAQEFEIMIWLADLGGANPIADSYNAQGKPNPRATNVKIGNYHYNLYGGKNQGTGSYVYSFIATSTVNNFSGDIKNFFDYLVDSQSFSNTQYLLSIQAGTEAFSGSATFTTSKYNVQLNVHQS